MKILIIIKNIILIAFISTLVISCKKENNYENDAELCKILAQIHENDQRIRLLPEMTDPFFKIMDSVRTANNMTRETYGDLEKEEQLNWGKIGREIANKRPKAPQKVIDSLWEIQIELDKKNTRLLIDITRKRGWVTKNMLGCTEYFAPFLVFRHAPQEFWNELRPLIEKEYAEKRMGAGDYGFIDNHIRGRPIDFSFETTEEEIKIINY